jgi:hypothetical protein
MTVEEIIEQFRSVNDDAVDVVRPVGRRPVTPTCRARSSSPGT